MNKKTTPIIMSLLLILGIVLLCIGFYYCLLDFQIVAMVLGIILILAGTSLTIFAIYYFSILIKSNKKDNNQLEGNTTKNKGIGWLIAGIIYSIIFLGAFPANIKNLFEYGIVGFIGGGIGLFLLGAIGYFLFYNYYKANKGKNNNVS